MAGTISVTQTPCAAAQSFVLVMDEARVSENRCQTLEYNHAPGYISPNTSRAAVRVWSIIARVPLNAGNDFKSIISGHLTFRRQIDLLNHL